MRPFSLKDWIQPYLKPGTTLESTPNSLHQWLSAAPITLHLTATLALLHGLRLGTPQIAALYEAGAYSPAHPTLAGVLLSPLFHTNIWHALGNLLSFAICGALLEVFVGKRVLLISMIFGFWFSNPIATGIMKTALGAVSPSLLAGFLKEIDYGASNGVYGMMGAMAGLLVRPNLILYPFVFNAVAYMFLAESWLAFQHVIALYGGYAIALMLAQRPQISHMHRPLQRESHMAAYVREQRQKKERAQAALSRTTIPERALERPPQNPPH